MPNIFQWFSGKTEIAPSAQDQILQDFPRSYVRLRHRYKVSLDTCIDDFVVIFRTKSNNFHPLMWKCAGRGNTRNEAWENALKWYKNWQAKETLANFES